MHRLQLYIEEGRQLAVGDLAKRLFRVLEAWRATEPRADDWRYERSDDDVAIKSVEDCGAALEASSYRWSFGKQRRLSYEPIVYVGPAAAPLAQITYTCGIGPVPIEGLFAPSRFTAHVDPRLTADNGAALLQTWMLKAIEILRPRFGHVGSMAVPQPVQPLTPEPVPPVGWLTYLHHELGHVPPNLGHHGTAYPAPDGTLVVAYPELFAEHRSAHCQAIELVRERLFEAGALGPM